MSERTSAASTVADARPGSGTWTIDPVHSFVAFSVEHFTVAFARGIASGPSGTITIAADSAGSAVDAHIDATTLTTGNAMRDEKIRSPEVLDVEQFPTIDYQSSAVRDLGGNRFGVDGSLTLHGVTRPVTLDLVLNGVLVDSWGKTRLGLTATTEIRRDEFGSGEWAHAPLASGGFMVPNTVKVTLDIEATQDVPEG